jgi:citrate synthase
VPVVELDQTAYPSIEDGVVTPAASIERHRVGEKEVDMSAGSTDADRWNTAITWTAPGVIAPRGYPVDKLMGRASFTDVVYLMYLGELPDSRSRALLDAILVASVDHSTTSPSALTARTVASSGASVQVAATAGLLAINQYHGGAIEPCMEILEDVVARHRKGKDLEKSAAEVVGEWREHGMRLPGFGHRVHSVDPRTDRLFTIAHDLQFLTVYEDAARAVEAALNTDPAKAIPMNLDGAIAAILCGLGFPATLANPLFMISRFVGITMQAYEERTRQRPMRRIRIDRYVYDGPPLRDLPADERA